MTISLDTVIDTIAVLAVGIIGSIVTIKSINLSHQKSISRECLENVYLKLFYLIEPELYSTTISKSEADKLVEDMRAIVYSNLFFVHPRLIRLLDCYENSENIKESTKISTSYIETFSRISNHIDTYYDYLLKDVGLPVRDLIYRINRNQYQSKPRLYFALIRLFKFQLLVALLFLYLGIKGL